MKSHVSHFLIFERLGDWIIFIFKNVFIRPRIYLEDLWSGRIDYILIKDKGGSIPQCVKTEQKQIYR